VQRITELAVTNVWLTVIFFCEMWSYSVQCISILAIVYF
jgi:hypothetical protein